MGSYFYRWSIFKDEISGSRIPFSVNLVPVQKKV
jgi:hypothetical protein